MNLNVIKIEISMKGGIATPEKNSGLKLTRYVKTRTPLEAFTMLKMGQPLDVIGKQYMDQGELGADFYMMDKTQKLQKIAELNDQLKQKEKDIKILQEYQQSMNAVQAPPVHNNPPVNWEEKYNQLRNLINSNQ